MMPAERAEALLDAVAAELAGQGFVLRGGFLFSPGEVAPAGPDGAPARSVLLVGQAGAGPWPHFQRWRATQPVGLANPYDRFSASVLAGVAARHGARAVSPSDRPYLPFQQWAMRAERLRPSPLGILMHPEYGLWHAYRGALLFAAELALPAPRAVVHLCDACLGKPCLNACPVDAHTRRGFAHGDCLAHVRSAAGMGCRNGGCGDRNACPEGAAYRYPAAAQAFHMAAFAGLPGEGA
jgi:hypothetical protein